MTERPDRKTSIVPRQEVRQDDNLNEGFETAALSVLKKLCEPNAVLAIGEQMEMAVVARDAEDGASLRTAVVNRELAGALALREWITCTKQGRHILRYHITTAGRAAIQHLSDGHGAGGPTKDTDTRESKQPDRHESESRPFRNMSTETPLAGLARRRDKDGNNFLDRGLVRAGERLMEDFELANIGRASLEPWVLFLEAGAKVPPCVAGSAGAEKAHNRVLAAMEELGPGLADVALRCCCLLEGLEQTERKMGWAARSGKIVLRIALQRLRRHYDTVGGDDDLIG